MSEEFFESRQRAFTNVWFVADEYRVHEGYICPVINGELVNPRALPFVCPEEQHYMPMSRPEIPGELAKVADGGDESLLDFVRIYGLLGYATAWRSEELAGIAALFPDSKQSKQPSAPGDPLSWIVAHARTVKLLLDLIGSLDDEARLKRALDQLTVTEEERAPAIKYRAATRGYLFPRDVSVFLEEPREAALRIIADTLDQNLTGVSRHLLVETQEDGRKGLTPLFTPCNLADCVYWHVADAAVGGWVRRCADPKCGAYFVAKSRRVKYCPPPHGRGASQCLNRHKQQRYREEN